MQDQAAQLTDMGIRSAVLNSALKPAEQREVMQQAAHGAYRLLYISPERIAREDTIPWLRRVPLAFFAIDEAHCISEWGHEFRPEYRQLSCLREAFPGTPIAAFTASATKRVRADILQQLRLQQPHTYIRSFLRPNLRYGIRQCGPQTQWALLLAGLKAHPGETVIIYAPTIARVEEAVDNLGEHGIAALPYHGKMDAATRQRNQEKWTSDEVRVLVGTIAFGLGINKPAVRAVIHLSLPKSLEQYYQESGRAGRDGQPSDCVLLWQARDPVLIRYFIDQIEDPTEKQRAWSRYREVKQFIESEDCRKREVCLHFGETPKWERCEMCDNCGAEPEWLAAAEAVEGHPKKREKRILPLKPASPAPAPRKAAASPPAPADPELVEFLRSWRRETARKDGVPAFMVLTDATLEDLARKRPAGIPGLLQVTGIGNAKSERYGEAILAALASYGRGERAAAAPTPLSATPVQETMQLLADGRTFEEIAAIRGRRIDTVVGLVADLIEHGRVDLRPEWVRPGSRAAIEEAAARLGLKWLKQIHEAAGENVTLAEVRLTVAELRRKAGKPEQT
jgi:ATP-dependent DNA helicase RecQ